MSQHTEYKNGTKVSFYPGPKSTAQITATVTGFANGFLVTKDANGIVRKMRPGSVSRAA